MKLEFTVCDVCKDPTRPVNDYTIARGSVEEIISGNAQLVTVERCEEHGVEFETLLRGAEEPEPASVRPPTRIEAAPSRRRSIESEAPRAGIESRPQRIGKRPRVTTMADIEARKTR